MPAVETSGIDNDTKAAALACDEAGETRGAEEGQEPCVAPVSSEPPEICSADKRQQEVREPSEPRRSLQRGHGPVLLLSGAWQRQPPTANTEWMH